MAQIPPQNLTSVYLHILDDVVSKVKPEYVNEGVDESILTVIRQRTEERMRAKGYIQEPASAEGAKGEASDAKAEAKQEEKPGAKAEGERSGADGGNRKRPHDGSGPSTKADVKDEPKDEEKPSTIPQQDGASDPTTPEPPSSSTDLQPAKASCSQAQAAALLQQAGFLVPLPPGRLAAAVGSSKAAAKGRLKGRRVIPQQDGPGDEEGDEEAEEDEGEEAGGEEEDDDGVGSDLDVDNDLDESDDEAAEETRNMGFAMYEKVHRSKNRWRCNLRYGVVILDGKEFMFNKAMADLQF